MADITGTLGNDVLSGGNSDDRLDGLGGDDLLNGRGGNDVLVGGLGNDIYVVDSVGDRIVELEASGVDIAYTDVDFWLDVDDYVELLSARDWQSVAPLQLTGNAFVNTIDGNAGNNFIDGAAGADVLIGFGGNDTYVVDNPFDRVIEGAGEGFDKIYTDASYRLSDDMEIELLSARDWRSVTSLSLIGNSLANTIDGNDGENFLDGEAGADTLVGMDGDDIYVVDDGGDQIVEGISGGFDLIYTSVDYVLAEGSFVETLSARDVFSTAALALGGNSNANQLQGTGGDNIMDGGANRDTMIGYEGNDSYFVDQHGEPNSRDIVVELQGGGTDTVYILTPPANFIRFDLYAFVENAEVFDQMSTVSIDIRGNELGNRLIGSAGTNYIFGADGDDYLDNKFGDGSMGGGEGADTFAFTTALSAQNVDRISDFRHGEDKISLDDAIFAGLPLGPLNPNAFVTGTSAADADDRIIYDSTTGQLRFDGDGNGAGAAVEFAVLLDRPMLDAADIILA